MEQTIEEHNSQIAEIQAEFPSMSDAEIQDYLASFENMKTALRLQHQIDTASINRAANNVVLDKSTMLDVDRIAVSRPESRERMLENHGLKLEFPPHAMHLLSLMQESIKFIKKRVLPTTIIISRNGSYFVEMRDEGDMLDENIKDLYTRISDLLNRIREAVDKIDRSKDENKFAELVANPEVRESYDIEEVLDLFGELADYVTKKEYLGTEAKKDACSILRVMKALDHYWRYSTEDHLQYTNAELGRRIMSVKKSSQSSRSLSPTSGAMYGIPIDANTMRIKEPLSVLKKLLHAEKYGATPPLDFVGAKIVTETRDGALKLFYKMFFDPTTCIVPTSNIQNEHTKNLLFDPQKLLDLLNDPVKAINFFKFNTQDVDISFETDPNVKDVTSGGNPLSSQDYRAAHFIVYLPVITRQGDTILVPVEIQITDMHSEARNELSHKQLKAKQQVKMYTRLRSGEKPPTIDNRCDACEPGNPFSTSN